MFEFDSKLFCSFIFIQHLSALPSSAPAREYSCPVCKHAVVPEKWSLTSGVGTKVAAFLRRFPWGNRLLPAAPTTVPASGGNSNNGSQPSTPLRAAILGASGGAIETPKARSRKQNEGGDVRVLVGGGAGGLDDDDDENKYANKRRWLSPV